MLQTGRRSQDPLFTVYAATSKQQHARLGVTVSRKVSLRAVDRNRIKRNIREAFRMQKTELSGLDIMVMARPAARAASGAVLRESLRKHWQTVRKTCKPCSSC